MYACQVRGELDPQNIFGNPLTDAVFVSARLMAQS